jgi:hypothetical protein
MTYWFAKTIKSKSLFFAVIYNSRVVHGLGFNELIKTGSGSIVSIALEFTGNKTLADDGIGPKISRIEHKSLKY